MDGDNVNLVSKSSLGKAVERLRRRRTLSQTPAQTRGLGFRLRIAVRGYAEELQELTVVEIVVGLLGVGEQVQGVYTELL